MRIIRGTSILPSQAAVEPLLQLETSPLLVTVPPPPVEFIHAASSSSSSSSSSSRPLDDDSIHPPAKRQRCKEEPVDEPEAAPLPKPADDTAEAEEKEKTRQLRLCAAAYCERNGIYLPILAGQSCCSPTIALAMQPVARKRIRSIQRAVLAEEDIQKLKTRQLATALSAEEQAGLQALEVKKIANWKVHSDTLKIYMELQETAVAEISAFTDRYTLAISIATGRTPAVPASAELFAETQDPVFVTQPLDDFRFPENTFPRSRN